MKGKSFRKILIANRGEIALRIMRTCRALGIATVAVYSDADLCSPHVRLADEAVHLGPPPSKDSYLNIAKVLEAARRTKAEAIHPGYGFLAENAEFAAACEAAGLAFIGPSAEVIRQMGLKSLARKIMAAASVPVVPGYDGEEQSLAALRDQARRLGFPLLIKASAGGGGKGMRVVREEAEFDAAIEGARREAEKAFGDGRLLLEKYIEQARHIEFQLLGDHHGHLVHLFERECSVQRRHQKIIEESPSPALSAELRQRMGTAAITAGRTIGYTNAGTVEFILAPSGEFYFIEVNTRLQVEHPVTEMVTGLDLVKLQIEIAEGKPLPFKQEDVRQQGHAIEARLYAEDPAHDFLPATGTILDWQLPPASERLRIESGVEQMTELSIYYDPLLAKLIAYGQNREEARRQLAYGLKQLTIQGVQTNQEFLSQLLEHPEFQRGTFHTGSINQYLAQLIGKGDETKDRVAAAVAVLYQLKLLQAEKQPLPQIDLNYRNNPYRDPSMKVQVGEDKYEISYRHLGQDRYKVSGDGWQFEAQVVSFQPGRLRLSLDGVQRLFRVAQAGERFYIHSSLGYSAVSRLPRYPQRQVAAEEEEIANAPMPGQVLKVLVSPGQQVTEGDGLIILEAMKMEQIIKATTAGIIEAVLVKEGEIVMPGEALVQIVSRELKGVSG